MNKIAGPLRQRKQGQQQWQDETIYCENCGISFVWTREEQRQHAELSGDGQGAEPHHCPGCRVLLAATPRERGLVKWYHRRKGYGFVSRQGKPDLYVHRSAVEEGNLAPDDLIEFSVGENAQGPMAEAVRILAHMTP